MLKDDSDTRSWDSCKKKATFNSWFHNQSKKQQNKLIFFLDKDEFSEQAKQEMKKVQSMIRKWIKNDR